MKRKILLSLLAVALLVFTLALPVLADDTPTVLSTNGLTGSGYSDAVEIDLSGMVPKVTLGNIQEISWDEYLINGYPPHADIILDLDGNGSADDALVFEYAYNNPEHYLNEAPMPYGAITGAWYNTFADDGAGPASVGGTAIGWLTSQAAGPYTGNQAADAIAGFYWGTLAEWQSGAITGLPDSKVVGVNTVVLAIHVEVDNWVVESTALVRNVAVDITGSTVVVGTTIADTATTPDIIAISVSPNSISFLVTPGVPDSSVETFTITNEGTVDATVTASVSGGPIFAYLQLDSGAIADFGLQISVESDHIVDAQLVGVPLEQQTGSQTGIIVFEAAP